MALTQDLPISNSMYKLLNLIIDARQQFPKAFRYEFGTELMMLAVHCCEYIRYANTDMNLEHRADYLMKFLCEFDALKLLLRVCEERHFDQPYSNCRNLSAGREHWQTKYRLVQKNGC